MTYPTIMPAITLDFQNSQQLDPRVTFSRSSNATYLNPNTGLVTLAAENEARFEKEGLLIEESRTNYLSKYMTPNYNNNSAVFSNYSDARFGSEQNAFSYTFPGGVNVNGQLGWSNPGSINTPGNNVQYTFSGWIKANQAWTLVGYLRDERREDGNYAFDLTTEWQYFSVSTPAGITDDGVGTMYFFLQENIPQDIPAGLKIDFACINLEVGGFPTSFIKTDPAAPNTVEIRAADIAQITGDNFGSWWNQSEGTQYADYTSLDPSTSTQQALFLAIGPNANYARGFKVFQPNPTISPESYYQVLDSVQLFNKSLPVGKRNAGAYKQDDYAFANENGFVDGITVAGTLSTPMTKCRINSSQTGNGSPLFIFSGHIARLAYYSERLTDIQLEAITL